MFHPEGVASLVSAILAPQDVELNKASSYEAAIDLRHTQVLELARQYYKVNPCNFESNATWIQEAQRNGLNNLAKLSRANLR